MPCFSFVSLLRCFLQGDYFAHARIYTFQSKSISMRRDLKTYLLIISIGSVLLALSAAFAQTPPSDTSLTASPVYQKDCAKCHGKTAEGRHFGGPSLISQKAAAASTEDLRNIITNGKGHMPKFTGKLTPEEIATLVSQIQSLNKK
jgi:cytochrome c553